MISLITAANTATTVLAYKCPTAQNDLWNRIKGPLNNLVGQIVGLRQALPVVIIGLGIILILVAAIPSARHKVGSAFFWIVGAAVLVGALITIAISLVGSIGC